MFSTLNFLRNILLSPIREPLSVKSGVPQKFDFILVLDFEATCDYPKQLYPQEIIEFPVLCLESPSMKTVSYFHQYVKPKINPILTPFCTQLIGSDLPAEALQETINLSKEFSCVLEEFDLWVKSGFDLKSPIFGKSTDNFAFVTCGNWDLKRMLPLQCKLSGVPVPSYMNEWINLKSAFAEFTRKWPKHMTEMANFLDVPNSERLHSGIDDCKCIARIVQKLALKGFVFKITDS